MIFDEEILPLPIANRSSLHPHLQPTNMHQLPKLWTEPEYLAYSKLNCHEHLPLLQILKKACLILKMQNMVSDAVNSIKHLQQALHSWQQSEWKDSWTNYLWRQEA